MDNICRKGEIYLKVNIFAQYKIDTAFRKSSLLQYITKDFICSRQRTTVIHSLQWTIIML